MKKFFEAEIRDSNGKHVISFLMSNEFPIMFHFNQKNGIYGIIEATQMTKEYIDNIIIGLWRLEKDTLVGVGWTRISNIIQGAAIAESRRRAMRIAVRMII